MRSLEGDIVVGIVVVVVVVSVEMGSSTVSSSVVSACAANVDSSESPRSALHARSTAANASPRPRRPPRGRPALAETRCREFRRSRAFQRLTRRAARIFASRRYDFRSVWSLGTVGGRDEF